MNEIILSGDLGDISGTLLRPDSALPLSWKQLENVEQAYLIITGSPAAAALAFKIWPALKTHVKEIIYPGGAFPGQSGSVTVNALEHDPCAIESLLNSGLPVVFCTSRAAGSYRITTAELAKEYASAPGNFSVLVCGVHAEFDCKSPAYGRLIADYRSDKKFGRINAKIILPHT